MSVLDEQGRIFEQTMCRQQGGPKAESFMTLTLFRY